MFVAHCADGNVAVKVPSGPETMTIATSAKKLVSERLVLKPTLPVFPLISIAALSTESVTVPEIGRWAMRSPGPTMRSW